MDLQALSPELRDSIFAELLELIGPRRLLRLRTVNRLFNLAILHSLTDSFVRYRTGPFHRWLDIWVPPLQQQKNKLPAWVFYPKYRKMSPPLMGLFVEAQIHSGVVPYPISALRDALERLDEAEPLPALDHKRRIRQVCVAASDYLDWDETHNFGLIWPGEFARTLVSGIDEDRHALLGAAVITGSMSTVRSLLNEEPLVDVNYESPCFGRPLQQAAYWGRLEILRLLLARGANPLLTQVHEQRLPVDYFWSGIRGHYYSTHGTALQVASLKGHIDIVRTLMAPKNALTPQHYRASLHPASRGGNVRTVQILLDAIPDLSKMEMGYIYLQAIRNGRMEVVKMMIELEVPYNFQLKAKSGNHAHTPFDFAATGGHARILNMLVETLQRSCDDQEAIYRQLKLAFDLALQHGHLDCVKILYGIGCTFPRDYHYLAYNALSNSLPFVAVSRLLLPRVDLDAKDHNGTTTLGFRVLRKAIEVGREPAVRLLLEAGVSPNCSDQATHPVLLAKMLDDDTILSTLLEFGGEDIDVYKSIYGDDFRAKKYPKISKDKEKREWQGKDF